MVCYFEFFNWFLIPTHLNRKYRRLGVKSVNNNLLLCVITKDFSNSIHAGNFIKDIARLGGDISNFTNEFVSNKLKEKFKWI